MPGSNADPVWEKAAFGAGQGNVWRPDPIVVVSRNGAIRANVEATAIALDIAKERGLGLHECSFDLYGSAALGLVACVPIPLDQATPVSVPVRLQVRKKSTRARWHLGGLLKTIPSLRTKADVKCSVTRGTGPDNLPALIISLRAEVPTLRSSRQAGAESSE